MMSIKDIEVAITKLSAKELADLAAWFADYQARVWDEQIEKDLETGKLDRFLTEVESEYKADKMKPL